MGLFFGLSQPQVCARVQWLSALFFPIKSIGRRRDDMFTALPAPGLPPIGERRRAGGWR